MNPEEIAALIASFQTMAKSNADLAAAVQAGASQPPASPTSTTANVAAGTPPETTAGAVALADVKVPMKMGDNAEERLINFHQWKEEVNDKLDVTGITDEKRRLTIAILWGGQDIKEYARDKAGVRLHAEGTTPMDTWPEAITKIEKEMESGINEAFAMFKFRQNEQGQRSLHSWYKQLKAMVKTLRLNQCTCGLGYSEERAM